MAQIVCSLCERHQGSHPNELKRRDRDHIEMWREDLRYELDEERERSRIAVQQLQDQLQDMRTDLESRPVRIVTENLDAEIVREAEAARDSAYRARDRAFVVLATLHLSHYEITGGRCRCGRTADQCEQRLALDEFRALREWERAQFERRRHGRSHLLPDGHPGIVDARWDRDDPE